VSRACVSEERGRAVRVRTRTERGSVGLGLTRPNQSNQVGPLLGAGHAIGPAQQTFGTIFFFFEKEKPLRHV
jgi:hypothetical protein